MARPQTKTFCRIVSVKSVIDGNVIDYKDEGHSAKTHNPGIGRSRLLRALDTKSKLDGKAAFKVVAVGPVPNRLDFDIPANKVPTFPDIPPHCMWSEEDDARAIAHKDYRDQVSAEAQASGIAEARAEAEKASNVSEMAQAVAVAMAAVKKAEAEEAEAKAAAEAEAKAARDANATKPGDKPSARKPKKAPKAPAPDTEAEAEPEKGGTE
jgi:hypothetical protein